MRPHRALVLGLGRFGGGAAAVRFLIRSGYRVRVADRAEASSLRESVESLVDSLVDRAGIELRLGEQGTDLLDAVDLVVVNPAIPGDHPLLREATRRGIPMTQEANLFLEHYPGPVLMVTGTNGKSSTSTLLAAALRSTGLDTLLGGNIGHSLLDDAARWRRDQQVAVLETSSFQLERMDPEQHAVRGAVLTRVTEDHLDRHGSIGAYHRAKAVAAALATDFVAIDAEDEVAARFPLRAGAVRRIYGADGDYRVVPEPGNEGAATLHATAGRDPGPVVESGAMAMPGLFQLTNAAAALTATDALTRAHFPQHPLTRQDSGLAIALTRPLPRRLQLCASIRGVRIFDNSVSTQVESTVSALTSLPGRIHWVGGGKSKDGRFADAAALLRGRIFSAHLFGSAGPELGALLAEHMPTTVHEGLEAALDAAWSGSRTGDSILFSPAFTSFDQFPNYAARAARFDAWVEQFRNAPLAGRLLTSPRHRVRDGIAESSGLE